MVPFTLRSDSSCCPSDAELLVTKILPTGSRETKDDMKSVYGTVRFVSEKETVYQILPVFAMDAFVFLHLQLESVSIGLEFVTL
jgi:hypothetical protein